MTRRAAGALLVWLLPLACTSGTPEAQPANTQAGVAAQAERSANRRVLGALGVTALLPQGARLSAGPDRAVTIELRPGTRHPHTVTLRPVPEGEAVDLGEGSERVAAGDVRLRYSVRDLATGGSGGDEQHLTGELRLCGLVFRADCHHQAEAPGSPDARFCLPLLTSIEPDPSSPGAASCSSP